MRALQNNVETLGFSVSKHCRLETIRPLYVFGQIASVVLHKEPENTHALSSQPACVASSVQTSAECLETRGVYFS